MNHRSKLLAVSAVIAALWCAAPMAQTSVGSTIKEKAGEVKDALKSPPGSNPPNANASAQGGSGSGVEPRTTGGSAAPYNSGTMKKGSSSSTRMSSTTGTSGTSGTGATGSSSGAGSSTSTASADTTRTMRGAKADRH
jgi:hypothetical protein